MTLESIMDDLNRALLQKALVAESMAITAGLMRIRAITKDAAPIVAELESGDVARIASAKERFEALLQAFRATTTQLLIDLDKGMDRADTPTESRERVRETFTLSMREAEATLARLNTPEKLFKSTGKAIGKA